MPFIFLAIGAFLIAHPIFGALLLGTLLSAGLGFISRLLAPKPKFGEAAPQGRELTVRQSDAPWQIVFSTQRVGGVVGFIHLGGPNNEFLYVVILWCYGGPDGIGSIDQLYFGDELVATGTTPIAKYSANMTIENHLGTDAQAASALLLADLPAKWSSTDKFSGHAYTVLKLKHDATTTNLFGDFSIDSIRAQLQGSKVLDPRTGTIGVSDNPVLCLRHYATHARFGMNYAAAEIDDAYNNAQANLCDELVPTVGGGTRKRYTLSGAFQTTVAPGNVLQEMFVAMAGAPQYLAGQWRFQAGAWRPPNVTLMDDDLRGSIELVAAKGRRELANGIKGTFLETTHWQATSYKAYTGGADAAAYLAEDGDKRLWQEVDFGFVTEPEQAQMLAKIALNLVRRQKRIVYHAKLKAYRLAPGDTFAVQHARYNRDANDHSWDEKTFYIERMSLAFEEDGQGGRIVGVDIHAREEDALVYTWNPAVDAVAFVAPPGVTSLAPTPSLGAQPNGDPTLRPTIPDSTPLNPQGNIPANSSASNLFTFAGTAESAAARWEVSWPQWTEYRGDGSSFTVPASSTLPIPPTPAVAQVSGGSLALRRRHVAVGYVRGGVLYGRSQVNRAYANTTIAASITGSGSPQFVTPASMAFITVGLVLSIFGNPGTTENVTVTAVTGTQFEAVFVNNHTGPGIGVDAMGVSANKLLQIGPVGSEAGYDGWIPLVGPDSDQPFTQDTSSAVIAFGSTWTEPTGGAVVAADASHTLVPTNQAGVHFPNLAKSTAYKFYDPWSIVNQRIEFLQSTWLVPFLSAASTPAEAAKASGDGYVMLQEGPLVFTTPSAGTANSTGGGGGGGGRGTM